MSWLMLKQKYKSLLFILAILIYTSKMLCLFVATGQRWKETGGLSGGNAEQSSEPIWASGTVCGNNSHLLSIISGRTPNYDTCR